MIEADTGGQQTDAAFQRINVDVLGHQPNDLVVASVERRGQHPEARLCTMIQKTADQLRIAAPTSVCQDWKEVFFGSFEIENEAVGINKLCLKQRTNRSEVPPDPGLLR